MGKNKVRLGGSKGQRWAKGQSSNSNPSKDRHRTQAKSRFFSTAPEGESKLTSAALLRHDAVQGGLGREELLEQQDATADRKSVV